MIGVNDGQRTDGRTAGRHTRKRNASAIRIVRRKRINLTRWVRVAVCSVFKALNWTVGDVDNQSSSAEHLQYVVKNMHRACSADQGVYHLAYTHHVSCITVW